MHAEVAAHILAAVTVTFAKTALRTTINPVKS